MLVLATAAATALFVWWFSTLAILFANGLPRRAGAWTAVAATILLVGALAGLALTRDVATQGGAYLAFGCAIAVWGWHELMFLTGRITGPRTIPAPPAAEGVDRFKAATATVIYHEVALALTLILVAVLTLGGANWVGLATFATLWVMRLSAKLNVYLGVRNLSESFLPDHLAYLETYFRRQRMNALLPWSVAAAVAVAAATLHGTWASEDPFVVVGGTLTGTLLLLAVVEHLFMVAPFEATALWRWGFASRRMTSHGGLKRAADTLA
ncbi:putative photosynthetic complex assembly protein PuhE [Acuticoccus sp.]|uniref:putative photosynthetic complex assembly protein PuhE n=1 Tax=Acuticoccus sp. TaxID=1904378 RepID=UPI003B52F2D9